MPELAKLVDSGLVRIIDLTFITKDAAGNVEVVKYNAVEELAAFAGLDAEVGGILTDEDVAHAAMSLEPNSSAILGFPGNKFTGQIVPELAKLIDSGVVRIIDLTFISKDADGEVSVVEYDAVEELAAFAGLDAEMGGILTEEDIAYAALSLEPNSSAALLVWEDTWAAPFAAAVRNANGVILEGARIPREIIEEAMDALADALA